MPVKILLVDDSRMVQMILPALWASRWGDRVQVIGALTIEEARTQFASNSDLALIVMDARMEKGSKGPDTLDLVREFRKTFEGLIVAHSMDDKYNQPLVEAGCNRVAEEKFKLDSVLAELGLH